MDTKQAPKTGKVQISVERDLVEDAMKATGGKFVTAVGVVRHLLVEAVAKKDFGWKIAQLRAGPLGLSREEAEEAMAAGEMDEGRDDSEARAAGGPR